MAGLGVGIGGSSGTVTAWAANNNDNRGGTRAPAPAAPAPRSTRRCAKTYLYPWARKGPVGGPGEIFLCMVHLTAIFVATFYFYQTEMLASARKQAAQISNPASWEEVSDVVGWWDNWDAVVALVPAYMGDYNGYVSLRCVCCLRRIVLPFNFSTLTDPPVPLLQQPTGRQQRARPSVPKHTFADVFHRHRAGAVPSVASLPRQQHRSNEDGKRRARGQVSANGLRPDKCGSVR